MAGLSISKVPGLFGLTRKAIFVAVGIILWNNSAFFGPSVTANTVTPVALPLGRFRLETNPVATGSDAVVNTIGMDWVAANVARTPSLLPPTKMTATLRPTRSAAIAGIRSK